MVLLQRGSKRTIYFASILCSAVGGPNYVQLYALALAASLSTPWSSVVKGLNIPVGCNLKRESSRQILQGGLSLPSEYGDFMHRL